MTTNYSCPDCGKTCKSLKSLRSHMNWHKPEYAVACSGNGENIRKVMRAKAINDQLTKENLYLKSPSYCRLCNSLLPYPKRGNTFCNRSCSATYFNLPRIKPKNKSMREVWKENRKTVACADCGILFETTPCEKSRKYCSVECSNKNKYHPNSVKKKTSIYKGFKMDSGAELSFAKLLDQHHISWVKNNSVYFTFIDSKGKQRKYYPDFYLKEYDLWIEIKGKRYIREDDDLRLQAVGNIELIMSDNIRLPNKVMARVTGFEPA